MFTLWLSDNRDTTVILASKDSNVKSIVAVYIICIINLATNFPYTSPLDAIGRFFKITMKYKYIINEMPSNFVYFRANVLPKPDHVVSLLTGLGYNIMTSRNEMEGATWNQLMISHRAPLVHSVTDIITAVRQTANLFKCIFYKNSKYKDCALLCTSPLLPRLRGDILNYFSLIINLVRTGLRKQLLGSPA